jgi:hypothetical protein
MLTRAMSLLYSVIQPAWSRSPHRATLPLQKVETCGDADDMFVDAKRRRVYVSCGDDFLDVFDANPYKPVDRIPTIKGARTSLLVPDIDHLFVAARGTAEAPAAVWVFRPDP